MSCATGCDKTEYLKSIRRLAAYSDTIVNRLKKDRPAEWHDLLNPRQLRGGFQGVVVTYYPFPIWLYRFDDKVTRGLAVNINSYRFQRDKHIDECSRVLARFRGRTIGNALRDAIDQTGKQLMIYPFFNFALYSVPPFVPLGLNSTAHPAIDRPDGSDSIVMFSPHMWNQDDEQEPGSAGFTGPGTQRDEVLFHELIHGLRYMAGVSEKADPHDTDPEEEQLAVILANIYVAEKNRQRELRGRYSEHFAPLQRPEDFLKNPQNRQILLHFQSKQPDFFDAVADVPAWWNPVRELRDAGVGRAPPVRARR